MRINLLCVSIIYALSTVLTTVGDIPDVEAMNESTVTVMFWNLENFFDFRDDGKSESDAEFSATGERRWTKTRFYRKCQAIAKTILWAGSNKSGDVPDIVGVAEVENRFVLSQLVAKTALRKLDYEIVHFDSPDPRGIDCALLYRASRLTLVSAKPCHVSAPGLKTRDILLAQFLTLTGDSLAVLVNHHPSKYGGGETDWRREVAVARLRALGDSLAAAGWTRAVAVGDFNDTPDNPLFAHLPPAFSLCRMTDSETALDNGQKKPSSEGNAVEDEPSLRGKGSIRFNGEWQLIDLCFVSPALEGAASFSVLEPPFLTERDAAHSGDRPLRTYSGPRYLGGVSDHRPILVHIRSFHHPFSSASTLPYPSSLTNSHYARPHPRLLHHSPMCTLFTTSLTSFLPHCPSTHSPMLLLSLRSNTACAKESSKNRDFLYK